MRSFVAIVVIFSLCAPLFLNGCFDTVELPPALQDNVVTIRFWHAMAGELGEALKVLIKQFEKANPGIRVVSVYQGSYGSLSQKLIGAVIAHEPPDVSQAYPAWVSYLNQDESSPAIMALDELIANDPQFDKDDLIQVLLEDCRLKGKLYALPFNKSFPVLYYNREMFKKAGLKPPRTWAEFAKVGRALTVDNDNDGRPEQWGWAFNNDSWIFECTVLQFGGALMNRDGRSSPFDQEPAHRALHAFVDAAFGAAPYAYPVTGYDHQTDFVAQKVAMIQTSSVSRKFMQDQLRFDYGMLPLPAGTRKASILSGTNICLFNTGEKARQEASWKFLKYFTSAKATAFWSIRTSYVPVRKSALKEMKDYLDSDPNARAAIEQLDYAYFEPTLPAWYECRQILRNYFQKVTTEYNEKMAHSDYEHMARNERTRAILQEYLQRANSEINDKLTVSANMKKE